MPMGTNYDRLDRIINERRVQRRMSWRDLAEEAGISEAALRTIRRGIHRPSDLTKAQIEDALGWAQGSFDVTLNGGEPTTAAPAVGHPELREARRLLIDALSLEDPRAMREAMADAAGMVARAIERERFHETG